MLNEAHTSSGSMAALIGRQEGFDSEVGQRSNPGFFRSTCRRMKIALAELGHFSDHGELAAAGRYLESFRPAPVKHRNRRGLHKAHRGELPPCSDPPVGDASLLWLQGRPAVCLGALQGCDWDDCRATWLAGARGHVGPCRAM